MAMTLRQLIDSSSNVEYKRKVRSGSRTRTVKYRPFSGKSSLTKKRMGEIFAYNKTVKPSPKHSIIQVSMMIKGVTDKKRNGREAVAAHRAMIEISGVSQEVVTRDELVDRLVNLYPNLKGDKDELSDSDKDFIIQNIAMDQDKKPFKGRTIMEYIKAGKESKFVIIDDKIPETAYVRVWCSCSSFYWCFQYYNIEKDACIRLQGGGSKMYKYNHRTDEGREAFKAGTPMRNPQRSPGMCKHLMLLVAMLTDEKVIADKGATRSVKRYYSSNIGKFRKLNRITRGEYTSLMGKYNKDRGQKMEQRSRLSGGSVMNFADIASMSRKKGGK